MKKAERRATPLGWVCAVLAAVLALVSWGCAPQAWSDNRTDARAQAKAQPRVVAVKPAVSQPDDEPNSEPKIEAKAKVAKPILPAPSAPAIDMEAMRARIEAQRKAEAEARAKDPAWKASHEEVAVIDVGADVRPGALNNFCLHVDGTILACCGRVTPRVITATTSSASQGGEIRVLSPEGELLRTWKLDFVPQAIAVHPDGTVFVGGDARLAKLDRNGKVLAMADSPALAEEKPEPPKEGADAKAEDAEEATESDDEETGEEAGSKSIAEALLEALRGASGAAAKPDRTPQDRAATARAEYMKRRLRTVTGIAVAEQDLFVATPMSTGYGYAVWRTDHDFGNAKQIVEGLRGCCGQMDVQAHDGELWIPENARHRVTRYDRDGKVLGSFGKRDRKNADGFGGCCEPKNLRFGPGGDVYTAESGPPVAVKRFTQDGQFLGVVGLPTFKTGCVRVTVEVSKDGSRVYVLHGSGNTIHVLAEKPPEPTHEQVTTIPVNTEGQPGSLRTFCLDAGGNLLAACGGDRTSYVRGANGALQIKTISDPAEIRVFDPEGKHLTTWSLEVTPQAVNVGPDGTVFVGGEGRLATLNKEGKVLRTADAPHVAELPPMPPLPEKKDPSKDEPQDEEAEQAKQAKIEELNKKMQESRKALQEAARELQASKDDQEKHAAAQKKYQEVVDVYIKTNTELRELTTTPEVLAMQKRAAALRKRAVPGIAATEKDLFVACPAVKGYGYDVWRMDHQLGNPKKIVTGLRGCCGQLDIQAHDGELYVAENSRDRVVRYDRDGNQLAVWGKNDRKDIKCFGSCCNPMNIRIGPGGEVYTSEASVGQIKRFSPDGRFLGLVGTVKLIPGCKHVAIGVSGDGSRVYMLDITRSYIAVLERRSEAAAATESTETRTEVSSMNAAPPRPQPRVTATKATVRLLTSALSKRRKAAPIAAKNQVAVLKTPLALYRLHLGEFPTTQQGLDALQTPPADLAKTDQWAGPYLKETVPLDPWRNPYQYEYPGKRNPKSYDVWSFGPDKVDGSEDDIGNWDQK